MSMHYYANFGHLMRLDGEVARQLGLEAEFATMEQFVDGEYDGCWDGLDEADGDVEAFLHAFKAKFGILPELVFIGDETDGHTGLAEPDALYLMFGNSHKFTMQVRPEWEAMVARIGSEPVHSTWTTLA